MGEDVMDFTTSSNEEEYVPSISEIKKAIFEDGNTWVKKSMLFKKFGKCIDNFINCGELVARKRGNIEYVTDVNTCTKESECAKKLVQQTFRPQYHFSSDYINEKIKESEEEYGITLAPEQREAIYTSVRCGFSYICGSAGCGKTTVLKILAKTLRKLGIVKSSFEILYLAPTGKASKRMTESTGKQAFTIDSKILPKGNFKQKVIVVDETSMMDLNMLYYLLSKTAYCRKIIFLGDRFQLSSVGNGVVLKDICKSDLFGTFLEKCYRQSANAVNLKKSIEAVMKETYLFSEGDDFVCYKDFKGDANKKLVEKYLEEVKKEGIENVALLVPYRQAGKCCSNKLNKAIRDSLLGESDETFLRGERVMNTVNESNKEVVNGEIGTIVEITPDSIVVSFPCAKSPAGKRDVIFSRKDAEGMLEMAYAMSVHKSQGSEYKTVLLATLKEHKKMVTRNLIYTGITRAKDKCLFFYDSSIIKECGRKEASELRTTMLTDFIQELLSHTCMTRKQILERVEKEAEGIA